MSLIHLDKSVLTFHFKEILEDGRVSDPLVLLGLGIVLFSSKLLPSLTQASRPVSKGIVKQGLSTSSPISLADWVAQAQKQQVAAQSQHNHLSSFAFVVRADNTAS